MKHLKMVGLAAIAAVSLMAFVGADTASATTIATNAAGTIHYSISTEIHLSLRSGTSALLETTGGAEIATCTSSTIKAKIEDPVVETNGERFASGTWVTGANRQIIWGGCNQTTDIVELGSLEIMQNREFGVPIDEATVVWNSGVTLGVFGVSCVYGTGAGTISGGAAPKLSISAVVPKKEGGFLCPSSARWTAEYIVTSPHELHFVE